MKNLMKFFAALVMLFTVAGAHANESDFTVKVKEGQGKVVNFTINDVAAAHVTIYAADGSVLFTEELKSTEGKINRNYDLAAFPEGKYIIETETGDKVVRYEVALNDANAVVSENAVAKIYKPVVTSDSKGLVSLNILNAEKTPVSITVYDDNNTELYNETIAGELKLSKKFDVSKLNAKNVTVVTKYNNKVFVDTVAAR